MVLVLVLAGVNLHSFKYFCLNQYPEQLITTINYNNQARQGFNDVVKRFSYPRTNQPLENKINIVL
jgi:hypothetical protein